MGIKVQPLVFMFSRDCRRIFPSKFINLQTVSNNASGYFEWDIFALINQLSQSARSPGGQSEAAPPAQSLVIYIIQRGFFIGLRQVMPTSGTEIFVSRFKRRSGGVKWISRRLKTISTSVSCSKTLRAESTQINRRVFSTN